MYPDVFTIAKQSASVLSVLGAPLPRLWPFKKAPQPGNPGYGVPYSTHQLAYGTPLNTLSCPPDMDDLSVQFDVYGKDATQVREVVEALRDAYEQSFNPVLSWDGEDWDQPTGLYRSTFTVQFMTGREAS